MSVRVPGLAPSSPHKKSSRKKMDVAIALVPFVDLLLTVVVFLLTTFSVSEIPLAADLPDADNGTALASAPIISVDRSVVTVDGQRVADTPSLLADSDLARVEQLVLGLEHARTNWETLHPGQAFEGRVVLQVDRAVDYRAVRKVLFSASQAGYGGISLAVRER
jgi:biopolymer transport protein ExbD